MIESAIEPDVMETITRMRSFAAGEAPGVADVQTERAVNAIREAGGTIVKSMAGIVDLLEEGSPLKVAFGKVKEDINKSLASLPETDKIPLAMQSGTLLRDLLCLFLNAQDMIGVLSKTAKEATETSRRVTASMSVELEKMMKEKIASGAYVEKSDHEAALTKAIESHKATMDALASRVDTHQKALASAKLPVPDNKILSLEDAKFTEAQTEAQKRIAELAGFTLPDGQIKALAWDVDRASFEITRDALKSQKGETKRLPNPTENTKTAPEAGSLRLVAAMC